MDKTALNLFRELVSEKLSDENLQTVMLRNTSHYKKKFPDGIRQFDDLQGCKNRISFLRRKALNNLDKYLLEFESRFIRNGGAVYWADTTQDVLSILDEILQQSQGLVIKSKSMTSEEVGFNSHVQKSGSEVLETDLGEFIVQQMGQKPSHITAPALHLSKKEIAEFFNSRYGLKEDSTAEEITFFVRKLLRTKFFNADIGVTGANFLVADTGSVSITENEGNASMVTAWPSKHIVIAGIDKIIPSVKDLYLFWPMLASHATGQRISVFNHLISGPARSGELDGPAEMFVILLNNNRHRLLEDLELREVMNCIHCGACSTVCPVFRRLSGHAYPSVYSGPVGAIITPHLHPDESLFHLSFASSLCGTCTSQCPADVPLHELLVYNRNLAVKLKEIPASEARLMRMMLKRLRSRKNLEFFGPRIKNMAFRMAFRKSWLRYRDTIEFAPQSFSREQIAKKKS